MHDPSLARKYRRNSIIVQQGRQSGLNTGCENWGCLGSKQIQKTETHSTGLRVLFSHIMSMCKICITERVTNMTACLSSVSLFYFDQLIDHKRSLVDNVFSFRLLMRPS